MALHKNGHVLYETGDADAPEVIKDRNGEVVLGLCRLCNRAEIELCEPCDGGASAKDASPRRCEMSAAIIGIRNWYQVRGYQILDVKPHFVTVRRGLGKPHDVAPEALIVDSPQVDIYAEVAAEMQRPAGLTKPRHVRAAGLAALSAAYGGRREAETDY